MDIKLTNVERETIINFSDDDINASIYTCNKSLMNRLDKLCAETTVYTVEKENEVSKTYNCPKKYIAFRKPRLISDKQRLEMIARAKKNLGKQNI